MFKDLSAEFAVLSIALMLLLLSCLVKSNKQIVFIEWLVAIAMPVIGFCLLFNNGSPITGSRLYILDGLSVVARCMILVMVSCMYLLPQWTRHGSTNCRLSYSFVLLVAALGMMLAVLAKNLFMIYLALELFSIAFYILISIDKTNWFAVDSGVRYFVSSSFFSGIYLYGVSLVYAYSGTTVIPAMFQYMPNPSSMLMLGYVMIAAGLLFKIGCVPFHMWLPDVYQGSPMLATILLSTASKFTIVVVFFRCLPFFLTAPLIFSLLFKAVGVASMIVGAFAALRQSNIKRLLAFGSMLHTGYIIVMLAFCVDQSVDLTYLLKAVLVYMFFYIVFSIGMFALVALCGKDNNRCSCYTIDRLSVINNKSNVFIGFCAAVLICSGVAVPPLAGFFAKFYILGAIIKHSTVITVIAMVSIIASSYYYIKMLAAIYFTSKDGDVVVYEELDQGMLLRALIILAAMISLFFVLFSGAIDQMFSGLIVG